MKTTIHTFRFDTNNATERAQWEALCAALTSTHPHCMESHGGAMHYQPTLDGLILELDTHSLLDNQWNTVGIPCGHESRSLSVSREVKGKNSNRDACGLRVFDWALDYKPNGKPNIKQGHYLDQTDEMTAIRANTMKCGYCGKQEPAAKGYVFCPHCMGSGYLGENQLHLTRMRPVKAGFQYQSPELSDAERAHLLPIYREAQIHGNRERDVTRIIKQRSEIAASYEKAIRVATEERDGKTWLMNHDINPELALYYSHKSTFSFGWRKKMSQGQADVLRAALAEFPAAFTIEVE